VSLDNCEVNYEFMQPVLDQCANKHGLERGAVVVVSSHTHSAPVLDGPLNNMYFLSPEDRQHITTYSQNLQQKLVEVVDAALDDLQPVTVEHAVGRATPRCRRVGEDDSFWVCVPRHKHSVGRGLVCRLRRLHGLCP
jgi:hypothetical protein